jgi:TonB family protein
MAGKPTGRSRRSSNGIGLAVTLVLHGGILAAFGVTCSGSQSAAARPNRNFVSAELVKLGKEAPPEQLPREPVEPHATAPKAGISHDPDAKPVTRPPDPPPGAEPDRALRRGRSFPSETEEPDRGTPVAPPGTAAEAKGDPYLAKVIALLHQSYKVPAGTAAPSGDTAPEIQFRIDADGTISDIQLTKSSGDGLADAACLQAAALTRKLPTPPTWIRGIRVRCEGAGEANPGMR